MLEQRRHKHGKEPGGFGWGQAWISILKKVVGLGFVEIEGKVLLKELRTRGNKGVSLEKVFKWKEQPMQRP